MNRGIQIRWSVPFFLCQIRLSTGILVQIRNHNHIRKQKKNIVHQTQSLPKHSQTSWCSFLDQSGAKSEPTWNWLSPVFPRLARIACFRFEVWLGYRLICVLLRLALWFSLVERWKCASQCIVNISLVSAGKQGKHLLRKKLFLKHFLLVEDSLAVPNKPFVRSKINRNTIVT